MTSPTPEAPSSSREFTTIGVVGLGTMGAGIAEVFARNGFAVVGVEVNDESLERGRQHLAALHGSRGGARQAQRGGPGRRWSAGSPSPRA